MDGGLRSLFAVENPREVWLVTVAHAVNEFYSVALPPVLPLLVTDFGVSYTEAGILLTVYYAVYSVVQLPAGRFADRIGQRLLLAAGMVVLAAGILVVAAAPDFRTVVLGQALAGVGGSTYHPAGMSLISDIESGGTEGRAMGVHGLGGVAGTALAPALIGGVAALSDWRVALTVAAGVGVVYAAVFLVLFENVPTGADAGADDDGGGSDGDGAGTDGDDAAAEDGATRADGGGDSLRERIGDALNVPMEGWVVVLFVTNFAIALETNALRTFATSYLFERTGTTGLSNAVFFVMLVGAGVASLGAGRLADVVDRTSLGSVAMAASAVVLAATLFVPANPLVLVGWFFLLGIVAYATYPAMNAITSARSDREFSGSLFAVTLTAGSLGGTVGPTLFGAVAEAYGMEVAFPAIAVTGAVGAALFLLMRRV
jgi:MFS family permease